MAQATTAVLVEDMEADTVEEDLATCRCLLRLQLLLDSFQALLVLVVLATHTSHQQVLHLPLHLRLSRSLETPPILAMRPLRCPPELEVDSRQASQALVALHIYLARHLAELLQLET